MTKSNFRRAYVMAILLLWTPNEGLGFQQSRPIRSPPGIIHDSAGLSQERSAVRSSCISSTRSTGGAWKTTTAAPQHQMGENELRWGRVVRNSPRSTTSTTTALASSNLLEAVGEFYVNAPYEAAFVTCAVKASMADIVAQFRQSSQQDEVCTISETSSALECTSTPHFVFPRNLAFILYGGIYHGCSQHFLYNHLFPLWFGSGTDLFSVLPKVLFDIGFMAPFVSMPISYTLKSIIFGSDNPVKDGLESYVHDVKHNGLLQKYWSIWAPVQCTTFSIIPEHLRIPFVACVSFFWLIILSSVAYGVDDEDNLETTEQV